MLVKSWNALVRSLFPLAAVPQARRKGGHRVLPSNAVEALESRVVPAQVVSIQVDPPLVGPQDINSVTYIVEFSAPVTGVTLDDFQVVTTGSVQSAAAVELLQESGTTYRVNITGLSGSGEVRLDLIDDGTIFESSFGLGPTFAPFDGSFQGETFELNGQYPFVISIDRANPPTQTTSQTTLQWNVLFNRDVNGVDPADFLLQVTGSATTSDPIQVSGSNSSYTVTVTGITGSGDVQLVLADNRSIRAVNGNPLMTPAYAPDYAFMGSLVAGPQINSAKLVDLNGDDILDYVYGLPTTNQVGVALGTPFFTAQGAPQAFAAGGSPRAILAQDVNGDGLVDVVTVNQAGTVSVLRGSGDGSFLAPQTLTVGTAPSAVAAGDLDGDGFPELLVTLEGSNSVAVLRNDINSFSFNGTANVGLAPSSVAVGDVTADGLLDIIVANRDSNTVTVLARTSNGPFAALPDLNTGTAPVSVDLYDLDKDGNLDIVTANSGSNDVTVVRSLGANLFATPAPFAAGTQPSAIQVGDVNGDSRPDLLVANQGSGNVSLLQGNGNGTFQTAQNFATSQNPNAISLGDINLDGRVDFITSTLNSAGTGGVHTNRNAQNGTFFGQTYTIVAASANITSPNFATVTENDLATQVVLDVNAEGGVPPVTFTYGLAGPDQTAFTIDTATGEIFFITSPNFEAPTDANGDNDYQITVTANNGQGSTATQNVTIRVLPLDEFPIDVTAAPVTFVNENTPASTVLLDADASDQDRPASTFTFSLLGPDQSRFVIDPVSGELRFAASPDFENPLDQNGDNVYQLIIHVVGSIEGVADVPISVNVQPLNDNVPQITSPNAASVDENTLETIVVLDVNATDADLPAQTLTFTLAGVDAGQFTIDANTGEIRFINSPDFEAPGDFDGDNIYNVRVTVSEDFGGTDFQDITITVVPLNDNLPVYTSPATVNVNENFPAPSVVLDVNATDADLPAQTLSYFLAGPDAGLFTIDSATGEIRFVTSPDFEAPDDQTGDNVYQLIVSTQSANFSTGVQFITITVLPLNDNLPQITSADNSLIDENILTTDVVLDVDATDADLPAQTLNYSLSGPDAAQFTIDPLTGEIRFAISPDSEDPADVGGDNNYNIRVTVDDGLGGSAQQDLTIIVLPQDDNPTIFLSPDAVSVDENFPTSAVVVDVELQDDDVPPKQQIFQLSGPDGNKFTIDSVTGEIRFVDSPDFEIPDDLDGDHVYQVRILISDGDFNYAFQDLAVTVLPVNDNSPEINSLATVDVVENTPAGTVFFNVDATDDDLPSQTLTYTLSGPDAVLFSIDAVTGELRFLISPDYELPADQGFDNTYEVTVKVDDGLGRSTSQDISIFVENIFEPATAVPGTLLVLEDTPTDGVLSAVNLDSEGSVFFDIVEQPLHGTVVFDFFTGDYTYTPDADYNGTDSFTFSVSQNESTSSPATIDITITAVNDAPSFTKGTNQNNLEDSGAHVITNWATNIAPGPVTAVDEAGQALTFNVTNDNNALFAVQPAVDQSGQLTYTLAPNAFGTANVTVILQDNGGTANGGVDTSTAQTFTIVVNGINDVPVVNDITFNLRENAVVGQLVGTVTASDVDLGDSQQFAITSGNTGGTFAINPATGQITVANAALIGVDPHPTFLLKVTVTDSANSVATADVTIQVVDALVITFGGTVQTYVKTEGTIAVDPGATAQDLQVPNIDYNEGTLTVTINNPQSGDRLGVLNRENGPGRVAILHGNIVYQSTLVIIGQIVSGQNGGPLVIKLTSFASEAAVNALLQSISFRNTSSSTQAGTRSITFDLTNRAGDEHDIKTTQLTVASRSVPPTLTLPGGAVTYANQAAPIALADAATVTDPDSQSLNGGRLTVTITQGIGRKIKNKLSVMQVGGITMNGKDILFEGHKMGRLSTKQNSLSVNFNSLFATPVAVQALVRAIAFSTSSGNTNLDDRVVQFTLTDGIGSQTQTKTVHVT